MKASEQVAELESLLARCLKANEELRSEKALLTERVDHVERIYRVQLEGSFLSYSRTHRRLDLHVCLTPESLEYGGVDAIDCVVRSVRAKLIDAAIRLR